MTSTVVSPPALEHIPSPIDDFLRRQGELTAVERFAARHTPAASATTEPASARWWRDRLPAAPPGPGQQYGFVVDLDACTGCKSCVAACHSLNGLREEESWRMVGALRGTTTVGAFHQTVTSACHHCVEPACLIGCPANAYEKDPITGIVRHLDDSCIGCSYCTLTCPYEVPRFDHDLGIVRKCDMCTDRLAAGEAPACVQGCPTSAITIDVVDIEALVSEVGDDRDLALVPGAPSSALTVPTTRYRSTRPLPADSMADDHASVHLSPGHTPLAVMLVLTQVSVGAFLLDGVLRAGPATSSGSSASAVMALLTALLALGASVLHLGRPLLAWRAVLGLRHSWLSREIVAFSVFAVAATAWAAATVTDTGPRAPLGAAVAVSGLAGVGCSVAIYATTGRWWWQWSVTTARFAGTMAAGGATLVAASTVFAQRGGDATATIRDALPLAAIASIGVVLAIAVPLLALVGGGAGTTPARTRALLLGPLRPMLLGRVALGLVGGVVLPWITVAVLAASSITPPGPGLLLAVAALVVAAGEMLERRLFFLASVAPRMPGMAR